MDLYPTHMTWFWFSDIEILSGFDMLCHCNSFNLLKYKERLLAARDVCYDV